MSDNPQLHTLALLFDSDGQRQINLVYQSPTNALRAFEELSTDQLFTEIHDDYGSTIRLFSEGPLVAAILQECSRAAQANVDLSLLQARSNSKFQAAARSDPMVKLAQAPTGLRL